MARKHVLAIGLLFVLAGASANIIEENPLPTTSLLWGDGSERETSDEQTSGSEQQEPSQGKSERQAKDAANPIPSTGIGGGSSPLPTDALDGKLLQNIIGDEQEVLPTVMDLTRFLEGIVFDIEQQVAKLQYKIDTLFPEEEEPNAAPQAAETPTPSPWTSTPVILVASAAIASVAAYMWVAGSSTAVSSGKKPLFSPLFTRFEGDKVMEHPKRTELYTHIAEKPGIRLQDLCDETSLSRTAVTHHLRLLEQQHVIVSKRVGRSRHFYENGGRYAVHQKEAYALLQNDRAKAIMDTIQKRPGIIQKDICGRLDLQASIAHWHIKRLSEAGLVEPIKQGRTVQYFATNLA